MIKYLSLLTILSSILQCSSPIDAIPYSKESIVIDGMLNEDVWNSAHKISSFACPWDQMDVESTVFGSYYDSDYLNFFFDVRDSNIVCFDDERMPKAVERSDRVEVFFSTDAALTTYYGLEFDACNRRIGFKSNGYRNFEKKWKFPTLKKRDYLVVRNKEGYTLEARLSLKTLEELGIIRGKKLYIAIYRADYTNVDGQESVRWISAKHIKTEKADFHVPEGFWQTELN